jgi:hypothetical protein
MLEQINKILYYTKVEALALLLSLFLPIVSGLFIMGFFIFVDTFTGIWASVNDKGWRKGFESGTFFDGILPKLSMYPLILLVASGSEFLFPEIPFIRGALFLLMCGELKSLEENFSKILKINFFKLIKILITKGKKGLFEELEKTNEENNKNGN